MEQDPVEIHNQLQHLQKHQIHPAYANGWYGTRYNNSGLWVDATHKVHFLDLKVDVWKGVYTVQTLVKVPGTHGSSLYLDDDRIVRCAWECYVDVVALDNLCKYLYIPSFSERLDPKRSLLHGNFHVDKFMLSLVLRTHGLYIDGVNKSTMDKVVSTYNKFKNVFVLDQTYTPNKP